MDEPDPIPPEEDAASFEEWVNNTAPDYTTNEPITKPTNQKPAMSFLPKDYSLPTSSNYMKWQPGENTFRILTEAITGWEFWNKENKPVREQLKPPAPADIRLKDDGTPTAIKHFWMVVVWNYQAKAVQVLEITQATIQGAMLTTIMNENWGDPKEYDFVVSRSGSGLETEYAVIPNPKKALALGEEDQKKVKAVKANLAGIFDGKDPFEGVS